jgi:hypothetical protein
VADEKLIIDVQTRDSLTPALKSADTAIDSFSADAKAAFENMNKSLEKIVVNTTKTSGGLDEVGRRVDQTKAKVNSFADVASKKFETLGKAAVGIFTADVLAKTFGFSSAMDAVNKAASAVADTLGRGIKELLGFGPAYEAATRAAVRFEEAISNARLNREKGNLSTSQEFSIDARRRTTFDLSPFIGLPSTQFDAAAVALDEQRKRLRELDDAFRAELNKGGQFRTPDQTLLNRLRSEFETVQRNIRSNVERAIAAQMIRDAQTTQSLLLGSGPQGPFLPEGLSVFGGSPVATGASIGAGGLGGIGGSSGGAFRFNDTRGARALSLGAARQREQLLVAQSAFPSLLAFVGAPEAAPGIVKDFNDRLQETPTFAQQASQSFDELGRSIRESIGSRVVLGAFDTLSNFFAQAIQGQATLRDLGRAFVALGAQILSQQAAFQLLGFLGFGLGGGGGNPGQMGGFRTFSGGTAGVSSGGGGNIPLPLMSGGGGRNVAVSLNVTSLDPRNAADVVLSTMPAITRGLAAAIQSGQSRSLRVAVGGA